MTFYDKRKTLVTSDFLLFSSVTKIYKNVFYNSQIKINSLYCRNSLRQTAKANVNICSKTQGKICFDVHMSSYSLGFISWIEPLHYITFLFLKQVLLHMTTRKTSRTLEKVISHFTNDSSWHLSIKNVAIKFLTRGDTIFNEGNQVALFIFK